MFKSLLAVFAAITLAVLTTAQEPVARWTEGASDSGVMAVDGQQFRTLVVGRVGLAALLQDTRAGTRAVVMVINGADGGLRVDPQEFWLEMTAPKKKKLRAVILHPPPAPEPPRQVSSADLPQRDSNISRPAAAGGPREMESRAEILARRNRVGPSPTAQEPPGEIDRKRDQLESDAAATAMLPSLVPAKQRLYAAVYFEREKKWEQGVLRARIAGTIFEIPLTAPVRTEDLALPAAPAP